MPAFLRSELISPSSVGQRDGLYMSLYHRDEQRMHVQQQPSHMCSPTRLQPIWQLLGHFAVTVVVVVSLCFVFLTGSFSPPAGKNISDEAKKGHLEFFALGLCFSSVFSAGRTPWSGTYWPETQLGWHRGSCH